MNNAEFERLQTLKQKRTDLFSPYKETKLYTEISLESSKVKAINGVKELVETVAEFDDFYEVLIRNCNKGETIDNGNFEEAEKKLDRIRTCISRIDWYIQL